MINNRSFTYHHHRSFYHFLSSLILVYLLSACNYNPGAISTVSSTPTQQSSQIPTATQPDNNSGGINLGQDSLIPPIPPGQLTVVSTQDCPELKWQGTGSDIIVLYNIYRRQINTETWNLIATVPMKGDNQGSYTFCDKTIEDQLSIYEYAVSAQDHYGNESNLSEPTSIK